MEYCCEEPDHVTILSRILKNFGGWTRKSCHCKQSFIDCHSRNQTRIMLRAMWTVEARFKRFQRGTLLTPGLETNLGIFGKRVAAFYPMPEAKLKGNALISFPEISSLILTMILWHGY